MKKSYIKFILVGLFALVAIFTQAQQLNTLYFMKNIEERYLLNPAFQPNYNVYVGMPIFSAFRTEIGNNAVGFNDIIFTKKINGRDSTITFLHPEADVDGFYNSLPNTTRINSDFSLGVLSFGFRFKEKNYFNFGVAQKVSANMFLPKDLFKLMIYGVDTTNTTVYNFDKMGVKATSYTELAFGYSRQLGEKLTVGGNFKFLIGQANFSSKNESLSLTAGPEQWAFEGNTQLNASIPMLVIPIKDDGSIDWENIDTEDTFKTSSLFGNYGAAIDLGATYKLLPNLQLSAGVTDLGFIRWKKNTVNAGLNGRFEFNGVDYDIDDDMDAKIDSIKTAFEEAFSSNATHDAYTTMLSTRLNIGGEYSILKDKIGFGLLSSTLFTNKTAFEELTASVNFRPAKFFSASFTYTLLGGTYSSLGLGLQGKAGPVNIYFLADQVPLSYATRNYIPKDLRSFNFQFGIGLAFGNPDKKKDDNDKK